LIPREGARRAVGFAISGYQGAVIGIAATAFIGGLIEALFLINITRVGFAIANGQGRFEVWSGWYLSVAVGLLVAVGLVAIRVALAAAAGWQSANVATRVVARIRQRLSRAFLHASWDVQQAQRSGSLQELLSSYSTQASSLMNNLTLGVVAVANLIALLGMAFAIDALGALILVASVTVLGFFLRPLRAVVRRRARTSTAAGMDFAISVNEISELGFELHVFNVQDRAQARIGEAIERARRAGASMAFAANLSTPVYMGLAYVAIVGALAIVAISSTASLTSLGATMLVMLRSLGYGQAAQSSYISVSAAGPAIEELQDRIEVLLAVRDGAARHHLLDQAPGDRRDRGSIGRWQIDAGPATAWAEGSRQGLYPG
jgi:ABC-type multidrug transport system fused ATPase/permease subunit